ncbi:MAG TPA: hypothetical protein DIT35_10215, partial [Rhodospirillaceae bacterium]|nr:hypothetical protein [Rhodospirillaceae bacterium]
MPIRKIEANQAGLPVFVAADAAGTANAQVFSLSSHARAREALEFGLDVCDPGFNIFVVGDDRSGRMTATLSFLEGALREGPKPDDWVYLNNFRRNNEPLAVRLPSGKGRRFRDDMAALVPQLREVLNQAFSRDEYQQRLHDEDAAMRTKIGKAIEVARSAADASGLSLLQSPQGLVVAMVGDDGKPQDISSLPDAERTKMEKAGKVVSQMLAEVNRDAARLQAELTECVGALNRSVAENAIGGLVDTLIERYQDVQGLNLWFVSFKVDLLDNFALFLPQDEDSDVTVHIATPGGRPTAEARYAVNLLVDNGDISGPPIVLEGNPTYANLFGQIEYRQSGGVLATDYSLVQPGALHRANGGVLVLRAEALAANADSWAQLKGALRDGLVRTEEQYRAGSVPVAGAPKPAPVALDVKVVIVGAPQWYYTFFSVDPEFQAYFKVKAEIDAVMEASSDNLTCYTGLLQGFANKHGATTCAPDAID